MRKWEHLKMIAGRYGGRSSSLGFWYLPAGPYPVKSGGELLGYAIDFKAKTEYSNLDSQGVPLIDYRGKIGIQYNGCAISQYALGWHQRWIESGNQEARKRFLAQADWLAENQEDFSNGSKGVWPLRFDLLAYNIKGPWISSLIQAQAISVLLRAYGMTGNRGYMDVADRAFEVFLRPVSAGGVTVFTSGGLFFEEAPSSRPSCVLDGFLYSLLGVHEYALYRQSLKAGYLRDQALEWLAKNIARFDIGFWSRADLYRQWPPCPASRFYHNVHIWLLEAFFEIAGKNFMLYYAGRWRRFNDNYFCQILATLYKALFKIVFY